MRGSVRFFRVRRRVVVRRDGLLLVRLRELPLARLRDLLLLRLRERLDVLRVDRRLVMMRPEGGSPRNHGGHGDILGE